MPGRPKSTSFIVEEDELLTDEEILAEDGRLTQLIAETTRIESTLQGCARHRLIANRMICENCDDFGTLNRLSRRQDFYEGRCSHCNRSHTIRSKSIFESSNLSLQQILLIIYFWSNNHLQQTTVHELNVSNHTIIEGFSLLRELCEESVTQFNEELGGIDYMNNPITVEIDESYFFHRKYHRGRFTGGQGVFGAIERGSNKCLLKQVPDRTRETLEELINKGILPGTNIISDGGPAYARIDEINGGVYSHEIVIHQECFVDPVDPSIHTQHIEATGTHVKRKLKYQFGTQREFFPSYLAEYMWRHSILNRSPFENMLLCISQYYPI